MPRFFNPPTVIAPASRYSQAAEHGTHGRRLVISGQLGIRPDGSLAEGLEAQMEVAWDNLFAILRHAGMEVTDLVKATVFVTVPGSVGPYRAVRDRKLSGHAPACTYLEIAGLARPEFLAEIEGEAVKE
ncbi:MAG TPA: RidA family protein [Microvirga sp.]|jgi:enamine deaminase RidA (YjgF/YER057c/UK114 family)|nr:RidA family protein [Microvirga sp.]